MEVIVIDHVLKDGQNKYGDLYPFKEFRITTRVPNRVFVKKGIVRSLSNTGQAVLN